jgi:outer membrane biogenesis lipoprotein LolB
MPSILLEQVLMAQFFIIFCAVVTFALMACDPRPTESKPADSAWGQAQNTSPTSQSTPQDASKL